MASKAAGAGKETFMEEMTANEQLVEQTEEKMIYKFLLMVKEAQENGHDLKQLEGQLKALLNK